MLIARVAVPVPLGQAFSYAVPEELVGQAKRGARVLCDFGRRRLLGIVLDVAEREPDVPLDKLKALRAVVDAEPVLTEELLAFLLELARYYLAPIGEVVRLAVPVLDRTAARALEAQGLKAKSVGRVRQVVRALKTSDDPALRGQAAELWAHLTKNGPTALSDLERRWGNARAASRKLEAAGLAAVELLPGEPDAFLAEVERDTPPALTAAQRGAVEAVARKLAAGAAGGFLLDGVTASGKTEVYLQAVEQCLGAGGGAIVLVPEIALTPQLVARFRARLGNAIAVLHSGLSDRERLSTWKALRRGELRVAVGARSALFAPVRALRLICVDEEHDGSFKQEEGVRYHARDMALLRAHRAGAVAVLGSATPSLSSIALCREGRLERLVLPARATRSSLPEVQIVDLCRVGPAQGPSAEPLLSLPLFRALEGVLSKGRQAILFLNRRGFAPSLVCGACGHLLECPQCSVALTLHRGGAEAASLLRCHYCDFSCPVRACPACRAQAWVEEGAGTERIELLLGQALPGARIARLDRDVAAGAKSERVLERMRRRQIDVLIGTQMVTKGHDLPAVTLVGVLNADAALSMPDFRASERTFQLLVQVAGRAGRGDEAGSVMIQTRNPKHPAVAFAARHDVGGFVEQELEARRELGYPPFFRLALVRIDAVDEARARSEAQRLAGLAARDMSAEVELLGPAPAPIVRLRNRYRYRFLLRARGRAPLRAALLSVARAAPARGVRVAIDVDPVNML